jgi:hypothetical protein
MLSKAVVFVGTGMPFMHCADSENAQLCLDRSPMQVDR